MPTPKGYRKRKPQYQVESVECHGSVGEPVQAYCLRCRAPRILTDAAVYVRVLRSTKNNVPGLRQSHEGTCPNCNARVTKQVARTIPAPWEGVSHD